MKKRTLVLGALVVLVAAGIVVAATRGGLWSGGAVAQAPRADTPAPVPVEVATAAKKTIPVRIEVLGSVTPIASVAIKTRIDSEIVGVHFRDGAMVRKGDLLFTLDSRALDAQIKQNEGLLEGAKANLEQAERDVARYTELLAKNATTQVTLNNARTQVNIWRAAVDSNTGQLENLGDPAQLLHDPRPDHRPRQHGRGQGRQFRSPSRPGSARDHHPDRAGLCHLFRAARLPAGSAPGPHQRERDHRGGHPGRHAPRRRSGHHDREQRGRPDRDGAGSRHDAQSR